MDRPAIELLALDFDGVVSDSLRECLAVACATWRQLEPDSPLDTGSPEALREAFLPLMPLGNRAEDFGIALKILERGAAVETQEAYDAFRDGLPSAWLEAFHERFYRERARLAEADPEAWLDGMRPYAEVVSALPGLSQRVTLAIATAKDRRTVRTVLDHYGLGPLFPEERVLDKETGKDKSRHLTALAERTGTRFEAIAFIDDKLNHLDAVAPLGVRCGLAAWGYNGEREHALARERGFRVCRPEDLSQLLG